MYLEVHTDSLCAPSPLQNLLPTYHPCIPRPSWLSLPTSHNPVTAFSASPLLRPVPPLTAGILQPPTLLPSVPHHNPPPELIWGICLSFGRSWMKPCTHGILGVEEFSGICLILLWWLIFFFFYNPRFGGPEAYIILGTFFKKKATKIANKFHKNI